MTMYLQSRQLVDCSTSHNTSTASYCATQTQHNYQIIFTTKKNSVYWKMSPLYINTNSSYSNSSTVTVLTHDEYMIVQMKG